MSLRFDRESCARRRAAAQTAAAHLEPVAQERASAITSRAFVDISPPKSAKRRFIQLRSKTFDNTIYKNTERNDDKGDATWLQVIGHDPHFKTIFHHHHQPQHIPDDPAAAAAPSAVSSDIIDLASATAPTMPMSLYLSARHVTRCRGAYSAPDALR
jgi:hypothetical protein